MELHREGTAQESHGAGTHHLVHLYVRTISHYYSAWLKYEFILNLLRPKTAFSRFRKHHHQGHGFAVFAYRPRLADQGSLNTKPRGFLPWLVLWVNPYSLSPHSFGGC